MICRCRGCGCAILAGRKDSPCLVSDWEGPYHILEMSHVTISIYGTRRSKLKVDACTPIVAKLWTITSPVASEIDTPETTIVDEFTTNDRCIRD